VPLVPAQLVELQCDAFNPMPIILGQAADDLVLAPFAVHLEERLRTGSLGILGLRFHRRNRPTCDSISREWGREPIERR